jgi:hypothetical protein
MATLHMDISETEKVVEKLKNDIDLVERVLTNLNNDVIKTNNIWIGNTADEFRANIGNVVKEIIIKLQLLEKHRGQLRKEISLWSEMNARLG